MIPNPKSLLPDTVEERLCGRMRMLSIPEPRDRARPLEVGGPDDQDPEHLPARIQQIILSPEVAAALDVRGEILIVGVIIDLLEDVLPLFRGEVLPRGAFELLCPTDQRLAHGTRVHLAEAGRSVLVIRDDGEESHAPFDREATGNAKDLGGVNHRGLLRILVAGDRFLDCTESLPTFEFWIEAA
jgi:hypothetical protein